jgi:hypothetical protein
VPEEVDGPALGTTAHGLPVVGSVTSARTVARRLGRAFGEGQMGGHRSHAEAGREQDKPDGRPADAPFDVMTTFFHDVPRKVIAAAFKRGEREESETPFPSSEA